MHLYNVDRHIIVLVAFCFATLYVFVRY